MTLFDSLFYSGPMLAVFSDENRLQRMLDFESALADAEAATGLIPEDAAKIIRATCSQQFIDIPSLREDASQSGNIAIPLVKQLTRAVEREGAEAARYVHWGATSQDVIDTGLVLQMREGLELIAQQLDELVALLAQLAERHSATAMPGRTWLQHAVPITFGWKVAGWLDSILRHRDRLAEIPSRAITLQMGGAAGTLASLGADGERVAKSVAERLRLEYPEISWHSSRDRLGEVASFLGLVVGTLGKIARDISLLMQSEVGEVFESASDGRGGSSTMPQKRNPVGCSAVLAAAVRVPGLVATILSSMAQEHERGIGNWQAEWETLPQIFNLCAGALERTIEITAGLGVDTQRMYENLGVTHGLVFAERVSMTLARSIGKERAHELVQLACNHAITEGVHLRDALQADPDLRRNVSEQDLATLFDPSGYLGIAQASVAHVVAKSKLRTAPSNTKTIAVHGIQMNVAQSGLADKPVLVFSNSLGADLSMWDAQVAEFSRHFHVLRYDTRGHGRSSTPPGPYTIEQLGSDVLAMLETFNAESCYFCGLSMGGMIGQWLGIHAPNRVKKLVLCNTAAKIGNPGGWNTRIATVQSSGMEPVIPAILDRWFTQGFHAAHPSEVSKTRNALQMANPDGYSACCAAVRDADFRELINSIQAPTLVVGGTYDVATTPAESNALATGIPRANYVELNAAHLSNIEAALDFNAVVLRFLLAG